MSEQQRISDSLRSLREANPSFAGFGPDFNARMAEAFQPAVAACREASIALTEFGQAMAAMHDGLADALAEFGRAMATEQTTEA